MSEALKEAYRENRRTDLPKTLGLVRSPGRFISVEDRSREAVRRIFEAVDSQEDQAKLFGNTSSSP